MGGGCEVERGEISDKSCLSYFVIRSNVNNSLCPGSQFGGRISHVHQRDDDIKGENEADWRRNASCWALRLYFWSRSTQPTVSS